eukprot:15171063-Alexandrium_andersonii.AAC.1
MCIRDRLTHDEQEQWAQRLLPRSDRPAEALAAAPEPPEAEEAGSAPRATLAGVHFSAMSGPGPTGARPEHLNELL